MAEILPRSDGVILHFLKEAPAWFVIALFVGAFLIVWNVSHDDFIPRIIDGLIGALLTSIVGQRPKVAPATQNITTDTVTTDSVNTDQMDVTTENVNLKEK